MIGTCAPKHLSALHFQKLKNQAYYAGAVLEKNYNRLHEKVD